MAGKQGHSQNSLPTPGTDSSQKMGTGPGTERIGWRCPGTLHHTSYPGSTGTVRGPRHKSWNPGVFLSCSSMSSP